MCVAILNWKMFVCLLERDKKKIEMGNLLPKTKELNSESHRALSMMSWGYSGA